jgi:hypothetical protein
MAVADEARTVRFGLFEVEPRAGELRKNGVKIKLQEQSFRLLVTLLEHAGDVVEGLRRELWPTDTIVDFDHGLNAAVKRLRDALDDSAENPRFIETLPRTRVPFHPFSGAGNASSKTDQLSRLSPQSCTLQFAFDGVPNGTYVLHIDAGKVKPDRDYEASNHLVSLGSTAKRNSLLLRRREAGGGSC